MDYSWSRLGQLNTVLIVLLVVETLCVQITCMALLTLLVKVCMPAAAGGGCAGVLVWAPLCVGVCLAVCATTGAGFGIGRELGGGGVNETTACWLRAHPLGTSAPSSPLCC